MLTLDINVYVRFDPETHISTLMVKVNKFYMDPAYIAGFCPTVPGFNIQFPYSEKEPKFVQTDDGLSLELGLDTKGMTTFTGTTEEVEKWRKKLKLFGVINPGDKGSGRNVDNVAQSYILNDSYLYLENPRIDIASVYFSEKDKVRRTTIAMKCWVLEGLLLAFDDGENDVVQLFNKKFGMSFTLAQTDDYHALYVDHTNDLTIKEQRVKIQEVLLEEVNKLIDLKVTTSRVVVNSAEVSDFKDDDEDY